MGVAGGSRRAQEERADLERQYGALPDRQLLLDMRVDVALLLDARVQTERRLHQVEMDVLAHDRSLQKIWGAIGLIVFLVGLVSLVLDWTGS